MPHASYPTGSDLQAYIEGLGIFSAEELAELVALWDLDGWAAAASAAWEQMTGWVPFLADAADVERYYDPPGPNQWHTGTRGGSFSLLLDGGLVSLTSIYAEFDPDDAGDAAVEFDEYRLRPYNAVALKRPYTEIEFVVSRYGAGRSIRVTGKFGYTALLPDDVWMAILQYGANFGWGGIAGSRSLGMDEWKEADVMEKYGSQFKELMGAWERRFQQTARRYTRLVL